MTTRTERDVIVDQTSRWFAHSDWSIERFASERLAPALTAAGLIPEPETPDDVDSYQRARKAWAQRVSRIFHETQPFPLEWKWPWVSCLPDDYQRSVRTELLAMPAMTFYGGTVQAMIDVVRAGGFEEPAEAMTLLAHGASNLAEKDPAAFAELFAPVLAALAVAGADLAKRDSHAFAALIAPPSRSEASK